MDKKIAIIVETKKDFIKALSVYNELKEDFILTLIYIQFINESIISSYVDDLNFPKIDITLLIKNKKKSCDLFNLMYKNNQEYLQNKNNVINELIHYSNDLCELSEIKNKLKLEFEKLKPDMLIVFGSNTSSLGASLSAKMLNKKVTILKNISFKQN